MLPVDLRGQSEKAKIRILSLGLDVKVMRFPLQTQVEKQLNKVALANTHINCLCELKVFSSFQNFNFCDMHEPNEYSSGDLKSINFEIWDNSICKYPPNCQTARHYSLHIIPKLIAPKPSSFGSARSPCQQKQIDTVLLNFLRRALSIYAQI